MGPISRVILERSVRRGELPPDADLDLLVDVGYGFLWYRLLLRHAELDQRAAGQLAALIIHEGGVYPSPIGELGVSLVDVGDIAELAALELTRRADAAESQPCEVYDVVGPDVLTGPDLAAIWSSLLQRPIRYAGKRSWPLCRGC